MDENRDIVPSVRSMTQFVRMTISEIPLEMSKKYESRETSNTYDHQLDVMGPYEHLLEYLAIMSKFEVENDNETEPKIDWLKVKYESKKTKTEPMERTLLNKDTYFVNSKNHEVYKIMADSRRANFEFKGNAKIVPNIIMKITFEPFQKNAIAIFAMNFES